MAGLILQRSKAPLATEMRKQNEPLKRVMENSVIEELARKFETVSLAIMHLEGIHYATYVGIRIGKEKLGMIKLGMGFWSTILEYEKKGVLIQMMQS